MVLYNHSLPVLCKIILSLLSVTDAVVSPSFPVFFGDTGIPLNVHPNPNMLLYLLCFRLYDL